jgi:hypothetical protein
MSEPRRERGKSFHLSLWRVGLRAGAFFLLLAFGVFVGYIGGLIIHAAYNNPQGTQWGFVCGCGSPILLAGLLLVLGMVGCEVNLLFNLFRGEHLLVGEKALQCVTRGGKVVIHIPYANIKRVRVLDVIEQRGMKQIKVRKVSFVLRKDDGDDTIGFSTSFSPGSEKGEYCIEPIYQASPDQIGKAMIKKWQAFQDRHEEDEEEFDDEE